MSRGGGRGLEPLDKDLMPPIHLEFLLNSLQSAVNKVIAVLRTYRNFTSFGCEYVSMRNFQ